MRRAVATALLVWSVASASLAETRSRMPRDAGLVQGAAVAADRSALPDRTVRLRDVETGRVAAIKTTDAAGQFSFSGLAAGTYVVELLDRAGKMVGATSPIAVRPGSVLSVTVVESSRRMPAAVVGFSLPRLGTAASVIGAAALIGIAAVVATRDHASPSR
jgi:hypothetical protein